MLVIKFILFLLFIRLFSASFFLFSCSLMIVECFVHPGYKTPTQLFLFSPKSNQYDSSSRLKARGEY